MIKHSLSHIAKMVSGTIFNDSNSTMIEGITIDSRIVNTNNLFIPIVGEKFDGHIFIREAIKKGACAFLIDKNHDIPKNISNPYIVVEDTKKALQKLAKEYRKELDIKIIGITGSNGKTTTKDIIHSVLRKHYKTEKTKGNLNNDIGLPLTILSFDFDTKIGIVEMGMEDFGEISLLTDIANPDIAMITNIGDCHLKKLGTKENIARAKFEILENLSKDGIFIYNKDDCILDKIIKEYNIEQKIISFGKNESSDFILKEIKVDQSGNEFFVDKEIYKVNLLGKQQIYNAAIAVIVGKLLNINKNDIQVGLYDVEVAERRNELVECSGFDILNDVYKSNPQSLTQALNTLCMLQGYNRKIAVIADMLDLGDDEDMLHEKSGLEINADEINYVLFFGNLCKHMYNGALYNFPKNRIYHFDRKIDLIDQIKYIIEKNTLILVKGSRGMHMEEIVEGIKDMKI